MDYNAIGKQVKSLYNSEYAERYSRHDKEERYSQFHAYTVSHLQNLCDSFSGPVAILDIGCGTGRHFHALRNIETLTGVDVSPDMIGLAKRALGETKIDPSKTHLFSGNVFQHDFPDASFDLVYSFGVLAEHSPLDDVILSKVHSWMRKGGKFFFSAVDASSKWQRKFLEILYPILPRFVKAKLFFRRKSFYLSKRQLDVLLQNSDFRVIFIERLASDSKKWKGAHFMCLLEKE